MKTLKVDWYITGYHLFRRRPLQNECLKGNTIGRVPANLCRAFRKLKEQKLASNFRCTYTNEVICLPQNKKFKRNLAGGFDSSGGGVVLKCTYDCNYEETDFEKVADVVKENVPGEEMYRFS